MALVLLLEAEGIKAVLLSILILLCLFVSNLPNEDVLLIIGVVNDGRGGVGGGGDGIVVVAAAVATAAASAIVVAVFVAFVILCW